MVLQFKWRLLTILSWLSRVLIVTAFDTWAPSYNTENLFYIILCKSHIGMRILQARSHQKLLSNPKPNINCLINENWSWYRNFIATVEMQKMSSRRFHRFAHRVARQVIDSFINIIGVDVTKMPTELKKCLERFYPWGVLKVFVF